MKKHKLLSILLSLVIIFGCATTTSMNASAGTIYATAPQLYGLVGEGYNGGSKGPVSITKGRLGNATIYLVTLSGTEFVKNQSTGVWTDILAAFNLNNSYYKNVVNIVSNNIPAGSNIMFAGHSLGGMVAQQCAGDNTLKGRYNIMYTLCYGAPLLAAGTREGTVVRLGDTSDIVPYASGSTINNTAWAIAGLQKESGGYGMNAYAAHIESYGRSDVWGAYDVTGQKGGNQRLDLDMWTQTWFQSPTSTSR